MKTFTTSRGVTLEIESIALLLDKIQSQNPFPEPPTYEAITATGVKELHKHTPETLETDEERLAWAEYLRKREGVENHISELIARTVLLRGVKNALPADEGWAKEQEFIGFKVPTDPMERRLHWLETEVLAGAKDIESLILAVMEESGVPEEMLQQMEATFQRPIRGSGGNTPEGPRHSEGEVVSEPAIRAGSNGHSEQPVGEPV